MLHKSYEFRKLIQCWQSMPRAEGFAPKKTTFSPVNLSSLMPYLFLIERAESGALSPRLLGSAMEEPLFYHGGKKRVFDAMMFEAWDFYDRFMQQCAEDLCGGRMLRSVQQRDGYVRDIESLHVPLADKKGVARFMLGVMTNLPNRKPGSEALGSVSRYKTVSHDLINYQYVDLGEGLPQAPAMPEPSLKTVAKTDTAKNKGTTRVRGKNPRSAPENLKPSYLN